MNPTTILIIAISLLFLVSLSIWYGIYAKKRILKMLESKYGKPTTRTCDERDYKAISQLFRFFPVKDKDIVDDITWNDLQMNTLYEQMNHSISSIGDSYFYRHLRSQQYDSMDRLERNIKYFDNNPKERLKLQYIFYKIKPPVILGQDGKPIDMGEDNYIEDLSKTDLLPKISLMPCWIINVFSMLSILLVFLNYQFSSYLHEYQNVIGLYLIFGVITIFFASFIYWSFFYYKTMGILKTINTFIASIYTAEQLTKLDKSIFNKELDVLLPILKRLKKSKSIFDSYKICMLQPPYSIFTAIIGFVLVYFGLYGFVYQSAVKALNSNVKEALTLYDTIGYLELCISQSSYRKSLSNYCYPVFTKSTSICFEEMYHPLLKNPVSNSKTIEKRMIITGANASGKSTFAKALAINIITAQTINICFAKSFNIQPITVYTSMKMEDDINAGDSFYIAEIKRLKQFLDILNNNSNAMFFADEILKGTNTTERIAAATAILKKFAISNCSFCLTTHDAELTTTLKNYFSNYHFKEITTDTGIHYDYKLYDGVTQSSNAIALLKFVNYPSSIVKEASELAENYIEHNKWDIV